MESLHKIRVLSRKKTLHVKFMRHVSNMYLFVFTEPELEVDVDRYNRDFMEQSEVGIHKAMYLFLLPCKAEIMLTGEKSFFLIVLIGCICDSQFFKKKIIIDVNHGISL